MTEKTTISSLPLSITFGIFATNIGMNIGIVIVRLLPKTSLFISAWVSIIISIITIGITLPMGLYIGKIITNAINAKNIPRGKKIARAWLIGISGLFIWVFLLGIVSVMKELSLVAIEPRTAEEYKLKYQKKAPGLIATVDLPAPDFELADLSGRPWKLSDLKGSVVVINFWATWCPPCRSEMSSLKNLNIRMMNEKNFVILTMLFKDKPENAVNFIKENKLSLNVPIDDKDVSGAKYGVSKVPETYIIDKKGVLRKKIIGPTEFDSPDAIAYLQTLLKE